MIQDMKTRAEEINALMIACQLRQPTKKKYGFIGRLLYGFGVNLIQMVLVTSLDFQVQEVSFEITTASEFEILGKILAAARLQLLSFEVFIKVY